jgi:hypothetical protein
VAILEAEAYQTRQDGQERPIVAYLGTLRLFGFPGPVRAFIRTQARTVLGAGMSTQSKVLHTAYKAAARLTWDFWWMPAVRRGELPAPDSVAMKADILGYTLDYWTDALLAGMQSLTWVLQYVEQADGSIQITGVATAAENAGVLAEPAESDSSTGTEELASEQASA